MSLDFDSGALQTQHEDEDYDQEDYAREQELQQLLTDLPHDMLEDSGDQLSNYSDSSVQETEEQSQETRKPDGRWNDHLLITDAQNGYDHAEKHAKNWNGLHNSDQMKHLYDVKEDYSGQKSQEDPDDIYLDRDGFNDPGCYQQSNLYHLPENFRPYTNGHNPEFNSQQNQIINFPDSPKEHFKQPFVTSEVVNGQSAESYKVIYKPYQNDGHKKIPVTQEGMRRNEAFEDLQHEFSGNDENSSENMQILQLKALNKARERRVEELNEKLEKSAQQIRYLSHQLSMVTDEKDGLAVSLHESQKLYQNGKEREVYLEGQIKALETQIQTLTTNEEQILKQSRVAEVAMESMQKQLLELQRSDTLQRAREQHDAIVTALKQKHEKQVLSLEQKLDTTKSALQEQKELCQNLGERVKELEKMLEETKCEKTEIINRLTRSLEESQKQCANLLQTGSIQEANQLRFQLQQAQSAHMISNNLNKALQEELRELKEEITLYESAAKLGVFLNDAGGELHTNLSDSCVDLGIKRVTMNNSRFCSIIQNRDTDKELSKDEIIMELKAELERLLSSNKMKRNQITQLQNDLKDCQKNLEEFKQLLKAEKASKELEPVTNQNDALVAGPLVSDDLKEEVLRLRKANETLLREVQNHALTIEELKKNEEKLKSSNQDLCCQMRKMVQEFDEDKQEAIDRCERTYQQHHEDTKAQFEKDMMQRYAAERQQLIQSYEETVLQLKATIEELNREMTTVKECYIAVCGEKDTLETTLRQMFAREQQMKEDKLKKQLLEEKEESLKILRSELEERYNNSMTEAKRQWQKEKEVQIEKEIAIAKAHWEKEEKEKKEDVFAKREREWQSRLEEIKKTVFECKDCGSQTDRVTCVSDASTEELARVVEDQKLQIQKALKEKKASEEALKELEIKLESKYRKRLASQVEAALTQAHARSLQELTDLKEYKLALAFSSDEEKRKNERENTEKSESRIRDLEEKVVSLKKELELKEEEIPVTIKAAVAKARAQWNKEKQEEIAQIQEQNERDYRSFLDDHRNKIKEVLATTKEDLAKQMNDLSAQKEAEMKMLLDQKQREWEAQEAKKLQDEIKQYEEKTVVELECLLREVHEELVNSTYSQRSWEERCSDAPVELNHQCKDKLKACLQKAYRRTVYKILAKHEQEWKEKNEELLNNANKEVCPCMQGGNGETGDMARSPLSNNGQQAETQRRLRRRHKSGRDGENEKLVECLIAENTEMKAKLKDVGTSQRLLSKGSVSKACSSCGSVKGLEEMRAQYIKSVSKIKKLSLMKDVSVGDMLCYIRESKERAAAMIKAEVLRERQETARKMRKYYLTCLQQLLTDNGKQEGAEKKIMNAASKLVTMAKGLETPLRHTLHCKTTRSALLLNSDLPTGVEYSKRDCLSRPNHKESKSCGKNTTEEANDKVGRKYKPRDLRQQFGARQTETPHMLHETDTSNIQNRNTYKHLVNAGRDGLLKILPNVDGREGKYSPIVNLDKELSCATGNIAHPNVPLFACQGQLDNIDAARLKNGPVIPRSTHHILKTKNGRTALKEDECILSLGTWQTTYERIQDFDFERTPQRDEGNCSEWSSASGSLLLDGSDKSAVYSEEKPSTNEQRQSVYCEESFSAGDENFGTSWREITNGNVKNFNVKNSAIVYNRDQVRSNSDHVSSLGSDKSKSANA
ncbi:centrosomal protein of 152 kDa [Excalfactoria chinensis]|uniref:centrosomal protein of 152 kDa n=1 Tax=Excalfactoria chinensis TaxID=46218 RepID=UPI003B3AAEEF